MTEANPLESSLQQFSDYLYRPQLFPEVTQNLANQFESKGKINADEGLQIYRRNLVFSLLGVLEDIFPILKKVLTDDVFKYCARAYIYQNPSQNYDLNQYGKSFPKFIQALPQLKEHAYLFDLGSFEYDLHQCYYAQSDVPISQQDFQKRIKEDKGDFTLCFRSSAKILQTKYSIHDIWEVYQEGSNMKETPLMVEGYYFIIYQHDFNAVYHRIPPEYLDLILGIQKGFSIGDLLKLPNFKSNERFLFESLNYMVGKNWLKVLAL